MRCLRTLTNPEGLFSSSGFSFMLTTFVFVFSQQNLKTDERTVFLCCLFISFPFASMFKHSRYLFHVLHGSSKQTLLSHTVYSSHMTIS